MILNADLITIIFLALLLASVIMVVVTENLIHAAIYMGTFSTLSAVVFLLLGAPDVALAEAIIGSTLSTIIYLIAIKKFRLFTIYYICDEEYDLLHKKTLTDLLKEIEIYLKSKELQLHVINTNESIDKLSLREDHSLIIENVSDGLILHTNMGNYHNESIKDIITSITLPDKVKLSSDLHHIEMPYSEVDYD